MSGRKRQHPGRWKAVAGAAVIASVFSPSALAGIVSMDVFRTESSVPLYAAEALGRPDACMDTSQGDGPVTFRDALDRSLCNDPKVRGAWQDIKEKAAELGQAKAAYLPTITANYQGIDDDSTTDVHNHPTLSSSSHSFIQTVNATADLVIWDFGSRAAASRAAREMILSATATYRAALQTAVTTVAKDYYAALGAASQADATRKAMDAARETSLAATMRVEHGAAPISDRLQADTSLQEAVYASQKADSDFRAAKGVLALDMGVDPSIPYRLPDIAEMNHLSGFGGASVRDLLQEAEDSDPNIASAVAALNAAEAQVDKAKADGLPTVSLTTKYTRNNQPASLGLGIPEFPATGRDWYVGVQVRVPIFDGFSRTYQIREAQAKVAEQEESVRDARKQVAVGVWTDYEAVIASEDNVESTRRLLSIADQSFDAANRRYRVGAGSILEVLNAQSALARAQKEHVASLADFATATLTLAAKLGRLHDW
ncbi:TolC family protein [Paraburkholderia megapolitana]|uniref:Protein CyaE n=1 Tax=Paraburkholderia megapolitana TaxID=420953 RepID=A0A1I3R8U1_9BURK|nr:TolC family protein [Paraburkholderia megapolitana]SFJ42470.1 outer membrane protein [Paraburkholderia megapolitana]